MNTRPLAFVTPIVALALTGCMRPMAARSSERPGLGTAWGETRENRVRSTEFERDDPEQPVAVAVLRYDDRAGVRAMTRDAAYAGAPPDAGSAGDGAFRVRLLDGRGAPLPLFSRDGRQYVEGRSGERYAIEVQNHTPGRVEAVATVDGLDVLDGRHGDLGRRGYIIEAWGTMRIEGFRRNVDEVAVFRFCAVADSYAARTGDDRNVGVVGVAFFVERGWSLRAREADRRQDADPFPSRFAQPPRGRAW